MIVGIGHVKEVGKDTAAAALVRDLGFRRDSFADDLKELGLPVGDVEELDGHVGAFLGPGPDQVAPSDQAGFSALIDRLHLFPAVAT